VDHGGVAGVCLVVARCDAPECFEAAEEVFDQMTPLVHVEVARDALGTIGLGRNDGTSAACIEFGTNGVAVESLVRDERADLDAGDQGFDTNGVMPLTRQQHKARQIAERIDQSDDFGRQPAAGAADGLILSPPFAPVPC
jgi:hypothetical protein